MIKSFAPSFLQQPFITKAIFILGGENRSDIPDHDIYIAFAEYSPAWGKNP